MMELIIKEFIGVCGVREETRLLAKIASECKGSNVLEMGCGTGYVSIYLEKLGYSVVSADISHKAVENTLLNAKLNESCIKVIQSDLYQNITGKYDIIIFNVPLNSDETNFQRKVKAFLRKYKLFYSQLVSIADFIYSSGRRKLILSFLQQSKEFLKEEGTILFCMPDSDKNYLESKGYKFDKIVQVIPKLTSIVKTEV